MNDVRKSFLSGTGVTIAILMVAIGSLARDSIDLGRKSFQEAPLRNLVASRDNSSVPEEDYFYEMERLLKKEYVEPITDGQKLASGAVRGMVVSLGDPHSVYMDKQQFAAYLQRRQGIYQGVGAAFALILPPSSKKVTKETVAVESNQIDPESAPDSAAKLPRLTVVAVVPGGPADKAGVKAGDVVDSVDNHWVLNSDLIEKFRKANNDWLAKKITLDQLNTLRKEVRKKAERYLLPQKALERLVVGTSGQVKVTWIRSGAARTTSIERAQSTMPGFGVSGTTIRLPFAAGSAQRLKEALVGKSSVTIDLTSNVLGDFTSMQECLAAIAPAGQYGSVLSQRGGKPRPLLLKQGNSHPPRVTLKVDRTTRGVAEIFALALESKGIGHLEGGQTFGDRVVDQAVQLPDGSGYTLATGLYQPTLATRTAGRKS